MKTIILIPCCKNKRQTPCRAEEMYIGQLFKARLKYAKQLNPDEIFILSAKYGLLTCDEIIEPYNVTLKDFSKEKKIEWSMNVLDKLKSFCSTTDDKFIILASNFYIEHILPFIKNYELPLSFCADNYIGKKMAWLKEHTQETYLLF